MSNISMLERCVFSLGKGEVDSSILSGSTIKTEANKGFSSVFVLTIQDKQTRTRPEHDTFSGETAGENQVMCSPLVPESGCSRAQVAL